MNLLKKREKYPYWPDLGAFFAVLIASIFVHVNHPSLAPISYNLGLPLITFFILGCIGQQYRLFIHLVQRYRILFIYLGLFYGWLWLSAFSSDYPATAIKFCVKYSLYYLIFIYFLAISESAAAQHVAKSGAEAQDRPTSMFYRLLLLFLTLLAGFGLLEKWQPQHFIFLWLRPPGLSSVRIASLLQNPNPLGALMALGLILSFVLWRQQHIKAWIWLVTSGLLGSALVWSGSRNALLILAISLILAIYPYRLIPRLVLWGLVPLVVLGTWQNLPVLGRVSQTLQEIPANIALINQANQGDPAAIQQLPPRVRLWSIAAQEAKANPLTGIGIQVFAENVLPEKYGDQPNIYAGLTAHNLFLSVALELGIPGLILFLTLLWAMLRQANLLNPLIGLPVSFVFSAQIVDYFIHDQTVMAIMFFILAHAVTSSRQQVVPPPAAAPRA